MDEVKQVVGRVGGLFRFLCLSVRYFCQAANLLLAAHEVKNWTLWIGEPGLSALSGASSTRDGHARSRCWRLSGCIARYRALSEALSREHFGGLLRGGGALGALTRERVWRCVRWLVISSAWTAKLDAFSPTRPIYCMELGSGTRAAQARVSPSVCLSALMSQASVCLLYI